MLRDERDYILRMIAAAAAAVARLRQRLTGGGAGSAAEVVHAARAAQTELLGKDASLLRAVDPASAAQMLGGVERLPAWVELLKLEADALRADGKTAEADALEQRARTLEARIRR